MKKVIVAAAVLGALLVSVPGYAQVKMTKEQMMFLHLGLEGRSLPGWTAEGAG